MEFTEMVRGIRQSDSQAWEEALRHFTPELRRAIRHCLADPTLSRVYEESDIIQSVLVHLLMDPDKVKETTDPSELLRQLTVMVRNKARDKARKERGRGANRRRRAHSSSEVLANTAAQGSEPLQGALEDETREEVQAIKKRLRSKDRDLLELREQGLGWNEVAARLGGSRTPEALKKQLNRALARARRGVPDPSGESVPSPGAGRPVIRRRPRRSRRDLL
jgi:RNA polymerase sigma factor (sigma-70 family)